MGILTEAGFMAGVMKGSTLTGTSKGVAQPTDSGPIREFLPNCAKVHVTSHGLSLAVWTHYASTRTEQTILSVLWMGDYPSMDIP